MSSWRRPVRALARLALVAMLTLVLGLLALQHGMIYFPRPYGAEQLARLPAGAVELTYHTPAGAQCAFYVPSTAPAPRRIWVMFNGNGSVALDWLGLVALADRRDGFLLVDYPGYGKSAGSASPRTIAGASSGAAARVTDHLQLPPGTWKWGVIGHSLGCSAALQFAAAHPVDCVILLAPFTTLRDMARRVVGWPLCYLLLDLFDNRAWLAELRDLPQPPRVTIFHGTSDEVVPVEMGRQLAAIAPSITNFRPFAGVDHNSLVDVAAPELLRVLAE